MPVKGMVSKVVHFPALFSVVYGPVNIILRYVNNAIFRTCYSPIMAYSSHTIANQFIELARNAGESLTNMQLQKLVFLAQGYTLAVTDFPLYRDNTCAWQWGPVVPELYKALQKYGRNVVKEPLATEESITPNSTEMEIIQAVWEGYGHMSGAQLSKLTHKPNTPWSQTWEEHPFSVIPQQVITEHYKELLKTS